MNHELQSKIDQLVAGLADREPATRQLARETLAEIGAPAVASLLPLLNNAVQHVRWEAAMTLGQIADPAATHSLIETLGDADPDVRWTAGEALIAIGPSVLRPLLEALSVSTDSAALYKGAHQVLHEFGQRRDLQGKLAKVLAAFDKPQPETSVPMAALNALQPADE